MSISHETAQTLSPFSSRIDPIREVPIERLPGQPDTGVAALTKKISISVAISTGALGSQVTPEIFEASIALVAADEGVIMRKASVTPGAISGGLGHFSMKRSVDFGTAPRTRSSNVCLEYAMCQFPD